MALIRHRHEVGNDTLDITCLARKERLTIFKVRAQCRNECYSCPEDGESEKYGGKPIPHPLFLVVGKYPRIKELW